VDVERHICEFTLGRACQRILFYSLLPKKPLTTAVDHL